MVPSFNKYNAWRARTPNSRMSILLLSILDSTPARHASVPDSLSLSIVIPIADLADRDAVLMRGFDLELFDCDRNRLFLGLGSDGAEVFGALADQAPTDQRGVIQADKQAL